ncbi:hypothetical protein BK816_01735 [Boudabousia tangfeifanii]|uniref:Major facilitator superfamily (MFS) profile domain-containing protein n=1 Tax=Boudabousia tangfeifanii TaxID=1912795 RepID=A0A1D9MM88_9ACTO|nr:hypothetical protein BK816_01735 [Boudabousia tangfeifanii]
MRGAKENSAVKDWNVDPWKAFYVIMAGGFMTLLDVSIVNVALPSITAHLQATSSQLQWIVAIYSLAFGVMLVPAGRFGDLFGRRTMFLVGIGGFGLASILCGLAPSANFLIGARLIQGAFAAVINPQVAGLIQQMFTGADRGRAYGYNGAAIGVATALGPVLGGVIVSALPGQFGWRTIFLINVPIALVVIPMAIKLLPPPQRQDAKIRLDLVGIILMTAITLLLMLPLIIATQHASWSGAPWWMIGAALAVWVLFMLWELWRDGQGGTVILPRSLMRTPSFTLGTVIITVYFVGFSGFFVITSLYLQDGLGLPAWQAGMMLLPFALGGTVGAAGSGRYLHHYGRLVVVVGLACSLAGMSLGNLLISLDPTGNHVWTLIFAFLLAGFGNGCTIAPNQALTLADVPVASTSTAAALLQSTQRIGTTLSIAVLTLVFFISLPLDLRGQPASSAGEILTFSGAFSNALHVTEVTCSLALMMALVDWYRRRHASVQ